MPPPLDILQWVALLVVLYLLGSELAPEPRRRTAGVLAAAVAGLFPGLLRSPTDLSPDLPLVIAVAWPAWLLLRLLRLVVDRGWERRRGGIRWLTLCVAIVLVAGRIFVVWTGDGGANYRHVAGVVLWQAFTPPVLLATIAAYGWFFGRRRGCEEPLAHAQRDAMFLWWAVPVVMLLTWPDGPNVERWLLPLLPQAAALIAVTVVELPGPGPANHQSRTDPEP